MRQISQGPGAPRQQGKGTVPTQRQVDPARAEDTQTGAFAFDRDAYGARVNALFQDAIRDLKELKQPPRRQKPVKRRPA